MKFSMTKKIGEMQITFQDEAESPLDFFQKASFYTELPNLCGKCDSNELSLQFRVTKEGYKYASILCHACNHELSFGQRRDGKGELFPKDWSNKSQKDSEQSNAWA